MRPQQRKIQLEHIKRRPASSFFWRSFDVPGGFPFNWHYHPEVELTWIGRGKGMRFVGDSIERFQPGDLCLIGENIPHTWSSDERSGEGQSIFFQFLPGFWGESFSSLPEMRAIGELLGRAKQAICFGSKTVEQIEPILKRLQESPRTPAEHLMLLLEALNVLSVSRDVRVLCRTPVSGVADEQVGRRLKSVLDRVHADIIDLPSQAELAAQIGLSPQAFSRFFRQRVGKTFVSYVNEWRIGLACRSLIETDEQITAVAIDSGFDNLSHFNRQFRRTTGMTPRDYRRRTEPQ